MMVLPAPGSSASRKCSGWRVQHLLVDRRDLVRQRHHVGGADREQRVEEVGELDAARLADEAEERAVGGEGPGGAGDVDPEPRLVSPDRGAARRGARHRRDRSA